MATRVIIDTDPGIDDAQAILFALFCGEFEIDALTTVYQASTSSAIPMSKDLALRIQEGASSR